jgi:uncharacterized protein YecE (DUF72 family)
LRSFLEMASTASKPLCLVFEFRHASWFTNDTYKLLRRCNAALCMADSPRYPCVEEVTADFAYLRFHGRTPTEAPFYADAQLRQEARGIQKLAGQGLDTYVYFNNDALAHAPANAARLKELLTDSM